MKNRVMSILLVIALAVSLCTSLAGVAYADGDTISYTVQNGDTVWNICQDLGLTYSKCIGTIERLNGVTNTNFFNNLKVGQVLLFPASDDVVYKLNGSASSGGSSASAAVTVPTGSTVNYKVKSGDTLAKICKSIDVDYDSHKNVIMSLNHFTSGVQLAKIYVGQVIVLPKDNDTADELEALYANAGSSSSASASTPAVTPAVVGGNVALCFVPHAMRSGESIFSVCCANGMDYSKYSDIIVALNNVKNPNRIAVGTVLMLPSSSAPSSGNYIKVVKHTIQAGQSTFSICTSYGLDYSQYSRVIELLNPQYKPSSIPIGGTLLIPVPTSAAAEAGSSAGGSSAPSGPSGSGAGSTGTTAPGATVTPLEDGSSVRVYMSGAPKSFSLSGATGAVYNASTVKVGETLKITPNEDKPAYTTTINVTWAGGKVEVAEDNSFKVPGGDVTVTLTYTPKAQVAITVSGDVSFKYNGSTFNTGIEAVVGETISNITCTKTVAGYDPVISVICGGKTVEVKDNSFKVPAGTTNISVSYTPSK